MADRENIKEFPNIDLKLAAPKKLSEFEKEKKAAEDKKKKEEAENAEALKKFQADFGDDDDDDDMNIPPPRAFVGRGGRPPTGPRGRGNFNTGRGGRGSGPPRSGPGSLPPHDFGLPSYAQRQKELNEAREKAQADEEDRRERGDLPEDEQDYNAPGVSHNKYQIHLTSIPPYLHIDQVKWILYQHIMIKSVQFPLPDLETEDPRTTFVAVATLEPETTVAQIDQACRELHGSYAGSGLYLGATRQLVGVQPIPEIRDKNGRINYSPYGAKKASEVQFKHDHNRPRPARIPCTCDSCLEQDKKDAADGTDQLPPIVEGPDSLYVEVHPPEDIQTVRIIHAVAENFRKGMDEEPNMPIWKEALMMKDPKVYEDENYAFLFDRQSRAGTYYMWALLSPDLIDQERFGPYPVLLPGVEDEEFDIWFIPPYKELPFLGLMDINDVVEHRDYEMEEDEEDDGGNNPDPNATFVPRGSKTFLDPVQWARFVWMMAGLPLKLSDLTRGHIARITNYCIAHADQGADEFVDFILLNVAKPICYTSAAAAQDPEAYDNENADASNENAGASNGNGEDDVQDTEMADADVPGEGAEAEQPIDGKTTGGASKDTSSDDKDEDDDSDKDDYSKPPYPHRPSVPADHDRSEPKLIALYMVSDLLVAAQNHGCWRYRRIFEDMLVYQKIFTILGKVPRQLGWTDARTNRWSHQVLPVLDFWASNNIAHDVLETMRDHFVNPYLTDEEREENARNKKLAAEAEAAEEKRLQQEAKKTAQSFDGAAELSEEPEEAPASAGVSLKPATTAEMAPKRRTRAEDLFGNDDDDDE